MATRLITDAKSTATVRDPARTLGAVAAGSAAGLTTLFIVLTVAFSGPEWSGIATYAKDFATAQVLQLVPILLLAPVVVALMAALHSLAPPARRVFGQLALVFSAIYAAIVATNYILQLLVVRLNVQAGDLEGLALLAMPNPRSAFVGLETAGYGFFSLMALCAGAVFFEPGLHRWIRRALVVTGVTGLAGTVAGLADQRLLMLTGYGLSLLAFLTATVLLAVHFRRLDPTEALR